MKYIEIWSGSAMGYTGRALGSIPRIRDGVIHWQLRWTDNTGGRDLRQDFRWWLPEVCASRVRLKVRMEIALKEFRTNIKREAGLVAHAWLERQEDRTCASDTEGPSEARSSSDQREENDTPE